MTPPHPTITKTADGCDTLLCAVYGQTYHSTHGALTEAEHVFFRGAGVEERFAALKPVRVLEIGFGTGLNFLLTAQRATASLHYTALEKIILPHALLTRLNYSAVLGCASAAAWREVLPDDPKFGTYHYRHSLLATLRLVVCDATKTVISGPPFDAVYLDAFSEDVNPELWTADFLARLFAATRPGGRLSTYSARGLVRRRLMACGYDVAKQPGPPGKREMLVAMRPAC